MCHFTITGDKGKSNKPARILLVGTHGEGCKKNVVGEFTSPAVDKLVGEVLNEYGNIFNIHAHPRTCPKSQSRLKQDVDSFRIYWLQPGW